MHLSEILASQKLRFDYFVSNKPCFAQRRNVRQMPVLQGVSFRLPEKLDYSKENSVQFRHYAS